MTGAAPRNHLQKEKTMKILISAVMASLMFVSTAQTAGNASEKGKRVRKPIDMQKVMEKTGGFLVVPGKGKLAIVNCQNRISESNINERIEYFSKTMRVKFEGTRDERFSLSNVNKMLAKTEAEQAFFIIDDPTMPMSLIAPESRWGFMNIAAIAADSPSKEKLDERFRKEFTRAAALTFGSYSSQFSGSTRQPVHSLPDFDKLMGNEITIDLMTGMQRNFQKLGVTAERRTTYKKACFEGWAPMPTNQWQRAIWEGVQNGTIKPPRRPPPISLTPGGPVRK